MEISFPLRTSYSDTHFHRLWKMLHITHSSPCITYLHVSLFMVEDSGFGGSITLAFEIVQDFRRQQQTGAVTKWVSAVN